MALALVASIVIPSPRLPFPSDLDDPNIRVNGAEGESRIARPRGLSRRHLRNKVMLIATRSPRVPSGKLRGDRDRVRAWR